jgi:SNF2 family DNA or RNA helicase
MAGVIVSKPNQALAVPRTVGMMRLFPDGKQLENLWVIKHGLSEYTLLRRLGFDLPNPIICYYDWANGTPFVTQKVTGSLLTANPRAYVLNDMGTGKTRAALWSWDYLRSNNYCGKMLVVCKLTTADLVWAHEAFNAIPHRKAVVLTGAKKKRLERLNDPEAEIFIINHDGVKVLYNELKQRKDIDVLCIDELATFRNNNPRSKLMVTLAQPMKFVWGMTGSPMPNEPTDVWMQCRIITPHTVPRYRSHARDMLMTKRGEFLWTPKEDAIERAYSWMQPAVRFTMEDVQELPEVVERYIDVPFSIEQTTTYNKIKNEFLATMDNGQQINAVNAAACMIKLLQVSGGYVYDDQKEVVKLDTDGRKDILRDLVTSASHKVLVFCPFRHMVEGLSKFFSSGDEPIEHAVIHGDVPDKQRNQIFQAFQNTPQYKMILAHPGCMSHGLTLTAADTIIWYCPMPSWETVEQANARIRRVGQKHRHQVIYLQGTPVERKLYVLLRRKAKIQGELLNLFADATANAQNGSTGSA